MDKIQQEFFEYHLSQVKDEEDKIEWLRKFIYLTLKHQLSIEEAVKRSNTHLKGALLANVI